MKKVYFGTKKIQNSGRIQLPRPLIQNLKLKPSDEVKIFLDVDSEEIIIRKYKKEK